MSIFEGQPGRRTRPSAAAPRKYKVAGLFAGIGGIELGLKRAGHEAVLFSEIDPSAIAVLEKGFGGVPNQPDVTRITKLPREVDLLTGGFPCQDLSQAGLTVGIRGTRSSLVSHVLRLLRQRPVETVVLENVPFMLQLARGQAMSYILGELEALGYKWAYRVVDSRAFGLPHRRRRVYIVASQTLDPRSVVFADEAGGRDTAIDDWRSVACGFYWTEGVRGLGWAIDAVPTLKGGSTVGIPSPPAVVMPSGTVVTPSIRAAERLQGFRADWTRPAEKAGRASLRWKLVGNAVTVPAATWIGRRLSRPGPPLPLGECEMPPTRTWPNAAYNVGQGRAVVTISEWPKCYVQRSPLADYLEGEHRPLSIKATTGFLRRTERSSLNFPAGFLDVLRQHVEDSLNIAEPNQRNVSPRTRTRTDGPRDLPSDGQNSTAGHGRRASGQEALSTAGATLQNEQ